MMFNALGVQNNLGILILKKKSKWHVQFVEELAPVRNALKINRKMLKVRSDFDFSSFVNYSFHIMMLDADA